MDGHLEGVFMLDFPVNGCTRLSLSLNSNQVKLNKTKQRENWGYLDGDIESVFRQRQFVCFSELTCQAKPAVGCCRSPAQLQSGKDENTINNHWKTKQQFILLNALLTGIEQERERQRRRRREAQSLGNYWLDILHWVPILSIWIYYFLDLGKDRVPFVPCAEFHTFNIHVIKNYLNKSVYLSVRKLCLYL